MNTLIIPDGNRRWARANELSIDEGYRAGTIALAGACEALHEQGETELWAVVCTVNNLQRPAEQVASYLGRFSQIQEYTKLPLGFNVSPGVSLLPDEYRKKYEQLATPRPSAEFIVNYMLGWSLDDELVRLVDDNSSAELPPTKEELIGQSDIKKPIDLIIRTGGVSRLSAMIPWHSPYAELHFLDKLWPEFAKDDMDEATSRFHSQDRRYGKGA